MSDSARSSQQRFFVSYSREDADFVRAIVSLMRTTGSPVFRDEDGIVPGSEWREVLERELRECDVVLVFWSASAASSVEVKNEYEKALELKKRLIPIKLDGAALPEALSKRQYIDFDANRRVSQTMLRNWMSDLFEEGSGGFLASSLAQELDRWVTNGPRPWWKFGRR